MASVQTNYQDVFLNTLRKDRTPITMHLVNGFQIRGIIRGYDNFVVIAESDGKQMMLYKHAISTITPMHPVQLNSGEGNA